MNAEMKILAYMLGITVMPGDDIKIQRMFDVIDYETGFAGYPNGFIVRVGEDAPDRYEDYLAWFSDFDQQTMKVIYHDYESAEDWILSDGFDNEIASEFGGMTAGAVLNMVEVLSRFRVANGKSALDKAAKAAEAYGKLLEAEANGFHGYSGGIFDPMYGGY